MTELIDEGVTGTVVAGVEAAAAAAAAGRIGRLDRHRVRTVAVERFGRQRMVDDYLAVYSRVIASPPALVDTFVGARAGAVQ
jgi:precorrin-4 methylase